MFDFLQPSKAVCSDCSIVIPKGPITTLADLEESCRPPNQAKGPSIKDVGIFFRFFDNPLPHVVMHVFNFIHQQISSCFDPYPPLSL